MLEPILVQGIEPGGQLTTTTEVENWPGDTEVQGPDLMIRMQDHAKAMGCEIIGDIITDLDLSKRPFTAKGDSGTTYIADAVILATGARAKWGNLPDRLRDALSQGLDEPYSQLYRSLTERYYKALAEDDE